MVLLFGPDHNDIFITGSHFRIMSAIPLALLNPQRDPVAPRIQEGMGYQSALIVTAISKIPEIGIIIKIG